MRSPSLADDLALAHRIVAAVASLSLRHFRSGVAASAKSDGSPVTAADREVESVILATLEAERSDDAVLSEEAGEHGKAGRRWIIDPIDGTSAFVAGSPLWATNIALEVGGEIVLGLVDCPALAIRYWAARGEGAFVANVLDSRCAEVRPLAVSAVDTLAEARFAANAKVAVSASANFALLRGECVWTEPTVGFALDLVEGRLDVVLMEDFGDAWDHAPWVVIVEEAGGAFFDLTGGRRVDTRHVVYTNGRLSSAVREALSLHG